MEIQVVLYPSCQRHHGSIAQLGEHLPYKQRVTGSSPVVPTKSRRQRFYAPVAQLVEQRIENPRVVGSIPTGGTTVPIREPRCGRSSSGRAPPCQGGGSEFEPRRPLQLPFFSGMYPEGGIQFLFFCSIYFLFSHLCKCCTEVFLFLFGNLWQ